jgi:hypothetical protein
MFSEENPTGVYARDKRLFSVISDNNKVHHNE